MKIDAVRANLHKKCIEIKTGGKTVSLPFSKLRVLPTLEDPIASILIDDELAGEAVTYKLKSGVEDSVHIDAFLDYNQDPEYLRNVTLYKLTAQALDQVNKAGISKRELCRKLGTSPAQLYRLLDTTNYSKSTDQMIRLLGALGCEIEFQLTKGKTKSPHTNKSKFAFLSNDALQRIPPKSEFKSILPDNFKKAA